MRSNPCPDSEGRAEWRLPSPGRSPPVSAAVPRRAVPVSGPVSGPRRPSRGARGRETGLGGKAGLDTGPESAAQGRKAGPAARPGQTGALQSGRRWAGLAGSLGPSGPTRGDPGGVAGVAKKMTGPLFESKNPHSHRNIRLEPSPSL